MPLTCPCCPNEMTVERETAELTVVLCNSCRHRCALHKSQSPPLADYHSQYNQGGFLTSLERTRRRQARRILEAAKTHGLAIDKWLDFGAGRGWFLDEARKTGGPFLAGADTSDLSVQTLKTMGVGAAKVHANNNGASIDVGALAFDPVTIGFLDVIEHFPPEQIEHEVRSLLSRLPSVRHLVIKVPISDGILFRMAGLFARVGWKGPFHQLFQVGTHPPHYHYFSKRSLSLFLKKIGVEPRCIIDDPDIDDVLGRVSAGGKFPSGASRLLTWIFTLLGMATSYDSRVVMGDYSKTS